MSHLGSVTYLLLLFEFNRQFPRYGQIENRAKLAQVMNWYQARDKALRKTM